MAADSYDPPLIIVPENAGWPHLFPQHRRLKLGLLSFGFTVFGSQRWFRIAPLSIQPSELASLALVLAFPKHLAVRENVTRLEYAGAPCLDSSSPALKEIVLQLHLCLSPSLLVLAFAMLFFAGEDIKNFGNLRLHFCPGFDSATLCL